MLSTDHGQLAYVDTDSANFARDPGGTLRDAGVKGGIARGPHGVEVFGYTKVRELLADKRLRPPSAEYYQGRGATEPVLEFIRDGLLLMMDSARHEKIRRVMVKGFKPQTIEASRPMMAAFAGELLDRLEQRERMEFVADFSHRYSIGVIARYIGVAAQDIPVFEHATVELRVLAENPMTPHVHKLERALADLRVYTERLVEARRRDPQMDLISDLVDAQRSEGGMTETELVWAVANVLLAGHDTTRFQLASCVRALLEADAWEDVARDPELIPSAVDEGMRLWPVTGRVVRLTTKPVDINGEHFAPGEPVVLSFHAAGRDPEMYDHPNDMDLHREVRWDIGFGRGPHHCLGHAVARVEMSEALKVLTQRLTDVRFDGEVSMPPGTAAFMRGPEQMPLRYRWR
jgi:cytochrome P450 family 103